MLKSKNVINKFLNLMFWFPKNDDSHLNPNIFIYERKEERMGARGEGNKRGKNSCCSIMRANKITYNLCI